MGDRDSVYERKMGWGGVGRDGGLAQPLFMGHRRYCLGIHAFQQLVGDMDVKLSYRYRVKERYMQGIDC